MSQRERIAAMPTISETMRVLLLDHKVAGLAPIEFRVYCEMVAFAGDEGRITSSPDRWLAALHGEFPTWENPETQQDEIDESVAADVVRHLLKLGLIREVDGGELEVVGLGAPSDGRHIGLPLPSNDEDAS